MNETILEEASDAVPRAARVSLRPMAEQPTSERTVSESERILRPYIDVDEIRKAYPNPVGYHSKKRWLLRLLRKDAYCVGGAVLKFLEGDDSWGFPVLHLKLSELNPNLDWENSHVFGTRIFRKNDSGDFEGAWQAVKEALEYGIRKE